jgi:GxxExxY protein
MRNRFQNSQPEDELARKVVGLAMKVHRTLGSGFLEAVYRNALAHELRKINLTFECHPSLTVIYDGVEVGLYQADLVVEDKLIVELKVVSSILDEHMAQLVNYLTATRIENGLLINFGAKSLEFRTKTRSYRTQPEAPNLQL